MKTIRQAVLVGAVALATLLLFAPAARAQQYPPQAGGCSVNITLVRPLLRVVVTCVPGSFGIRVAVTITIFTTPDDLGTFTSADDGSLRAEVEMPADLTDGPHTIVAAGIGPEGTPVEYPMAVTSVTPVSAGAPVTGSTGSTSGGNLARTGADSIASELRIAAALLAVGGSLVVIGRRRRRSAREV